MTPRVESGGGLLGLLVGCGGRSVLLQETGGELEKRQSGKPFLHQRAAGRRKEDARRLSISPGAAAWLAHAPLG
jgi:hypothetical protein